MSLFPIDLSRDIYFKRRFRKREINFICKQLAYILNSGLNMSFGFDVLIDNALDSRMRKCFYIMKRDLMDGLSICACFRKADAFPDFLISMISVGERTDRLGEIMKDMADFYEKDAKLASEIATAFMYPVFVAAWLAVVVICALIFVVPGYTVMFADADQVLPLATRVLIGMSDFLLINKQWILGFAFAAVISGFIFFNSARGLYVKGWLKLRIIIIGRYNTKSMNLYFTRAMYILLSSGSDVISALVTAKNILNNALCDKQIDGMIKKIKNGSQLSTALSGAALFDRMLYSMAKLGEETDRLPEALNECAKYLEDELAVLTSRVKQLVQPVSTLLLGLILAFIVGATMLPMIRMTSFY